MRIVASSQSMAAPVKVNDVWEFTVKNAKITPSPDIVDNPPVYDDCRAEYPPDFTFNARYGFRQSSKDKLRKIIVYYNNQCVRSYSFCYATDIFGRALLKEIEQYGTDYTEPAYVHKLDYYNEVGSKTSARYVKPQPETWNVPDDGIVLNPLGTGWSNKATNWLSGITNSQWEKPTALGGTQSLSVGGGAGPALGLFANVLSNNNSAGYSGNKNGSWSKGRLTLMDIDGDGLPDKVFEAGGLLHYRLQNPGGKSFSSSAVTLHGVTDFLRESSSGWGHGPQVSFGVYGGGQWSNSTSKTSVYVTDIDGDGFPDIAKGGSFISFTRRINPPLISNAADCLIPDITESLDPIEPDCGNKNIDESVPVEDIPYPEDDIHEVFPPYDVVKVWNINRKVENINSINIFAPVQLQAEENPNFCGEEDGVIVSIEIYGAVDKWNENDGLPMNTVRHYLVWTDTIMANDYRIFVDQSTWSGSYVPSQMKFKAAESGRELNINYSNISGMQGLNSPVVFFRARPLKNGVKARIIWDPKVYPDYHLLSGSSGVAQNADNLYLEDGGPYSRAHLLHSEEPFTCPFTGNITVSYTVPAVSQSDPVTYIFKHNNTQKHSFTNSSGANNYSTTFRVREGDLISFTASAATQVDWNLGQWRPELYYTTIVDQDNAEIPVAEGNESMLVFYPAPACTFYRSVKANNCVMSVSGSQTLSVLPFVPATSSCTSPGGITASFVVKKNKAVLCRWNNIQLAGTPVNSSYIPANITAQNISVANGDKLYFECYIPGAQYACNNFQISVNGVKYGCTVFTGKETHQVYGSMYGSWGQFMYRNDGDKLMKPEKYLHIFDQSIFNNIDTASPLAPDAQTLAGMSGKESDYIYPGRSSIYNNMPVIPMFPDGENNGYKGIYENSWIRGNALHVGSIPCYSEDPDALEPCDPNAMPGQAGSSQIQADSIISSFDDSPVSSFSDSPTRSTSDSLIQHPESEPQSSMMRARAVSSGRGITKVSATKMFSWSFGQSVGGLAGSGATGSDGESYLYDDLADLNGDGYPDVMKSGCVQYTQPYMGRLEASRQVFKNSDKTHYKSNVSVSGASFSGDMIGLWKSVKSSGKGSHQLARSGTSASVSGSSATDTGNYILADINGDGLPDQILENGKVRINLGYSFEAEEEWGNYLLNTTRNRSESVNAAAGSEFASMGGKAFDKWNGSLSGGISISGSDNYTERMLIDVNGDGLPDMLMRSGNNLMVRLNTGIGFSPHLLTWSSNINSELSCPKIGLHKNVKK